MNDAQTHRPVTSKPRGYCKYYATERGCFAGKSCKFLHAEKESTEAPGSSTSPLLTPYDKSKKCKFFAKGYGKREGDCWFQHVKETGSQETPDEEEDEHCSICFERPHTYGLLTGCSHVFCLSCLRQWRDPSSRNRDMVELDNTKKCPMCRAESRYITPSSIFYKEGQEEKQIVIEKYKESMSKVPCKHFEASKTRTPNKPACPFGKDCFYRHANADGTPYVFKHGVDASMRSFHRPRLPPFDFFLGETIGRGLGRNNELAESIAANMFDSIMSEVMRRSRARNAGNAANGQEDSEGSGDGPNNSSAARERTMAAAMNSIRMELNRLEDTQLHQRSPGSEFDPLATPPEPIESLREEAEGFLQDLDTIADRMIGSNAGPVTQAPPHPVFIEGGGFEFPGGWAGIRQRRQRRNSPPPLPVDGDDSDDIPELESVSDSSSEDMGMFSDSSGSNHNERVRAHFSLRGIQGINLSNVRSHNLPNAGTRPETRAEPSSTRFSTVLSRAEATPTANTPPAPSEPVVTPDEAIPAEDPETNVPLAEGEPPLDVVTAQEPPFVHSVEPPFVTDGRGRVVWTNKGSDTPDATVPPSQQPFGDTDPSDASASDNHPPTDGTQSSQRSLLGQLFNALF